MRSKKRIRSDPAKSHIDSQKFYTMSQIASLLDLDEMSLYRFAEHGELHSHKLGGIVRFRGKDIEVFVKKRRSPSVRKD
jgi:excisionase family DNA binding protein